MESGGSETMDQREAERNLREIRRMMEEGRQVVASGGHHYVAWGFLITMALVLTWGMATRGWDLSPAWIWGGAVGGGWAFSIWAGYRWDRRAPVSNLAGRVLAGIWIGSGIAMTLVGFLGGAPEAMEVNVLLATESAILGAAYLATAAVQGSRWMMGLAAGWWVGSVYMYLNSGLSVLLVMAALMVALYLVPGLWMMMTRPAAEVEGSPA